MRTSTSRVSRHAVWVLGFSAAVAQANPLMILGGINGVVDAVKRTAGPLVTANTPAKSPPKPRISLPGAHLIERGMHRQEVLNLVGGPGQTGNPQNPGHPLRDVYLIKRDGPCALDQIEVVYARNDGPVEFIQQKCGDVTSDENRSVQYSYKRELPSVFDRIHPEMPRESVIEVLGAPQETRTNGSSEFIDVHVFGDEKASLRYTKGSKRLVAVTWAGANAPLPLVQRAQFFESAPSN